MKRMLALLCALCMLTGCGSETQEPEVKPDPQPPVVTQEQQKPQESVSEEPKEDAKQEMVTIIMSAPLFSGQTIEDYVSKLDDPTAKVYDEESYTIEITEAQRVEVLSSFYAEALAQLQDVAGPGASIKADEYFQNIAVTGALAEPFSFVITAALVSNAAQAYNLIDPANRSCNMTLNGESFF